MRDRTQEAKEIFRNGVNRVRGVYDIDEIASVWMDVWSRIWKLNNECPTELLMAWETAAKERFCLHSTVQPISEA